MVNRGSIRPTPISVGVATGPQPPPPIESITPPRRPTGTNRVRGIEPGAARVGVAPKANLESITRPRTSRITEATGTIDSPSTLDSTEAPTKPPSIPGMPISQTVRQLTLPNLQWAPVDTTDAPSLATCTAVEADATEAPPAMRTVEPTTPNPMPSEPLMSCAAKPVNRNTRRLSISPTPPNPVARSSFLVSR